jgi:DNA primase
MPTLVTMPLFPQSFIDDVRMHADIVQVVQEYVSLKRVGATYKGLCPFHSEKTPSFHVNHEKGFFHCFGCNVGGDVFKFLELQEKIGFADAVKQLAHRFGQPLPVGPEQSDDARQTSAEREALLKVHEKAAAFFHEQLLSSSGAHARRQLEERGVSLEVSNRLGLGYAPVRDTLCARLLKQGFTLPLLLRSGLVVQRDGGEVHDRFRGRLMIPICRDTGSVIAFGGRAMQPDQQPKYLNSPETPIYSKGRTLYGLHLTKAAIRRLGYAVLVEGYFDFAQLVHAGIEPVLASCGTALTAQQAQLLRRFASKVILSFDPDAAGQTAASRSCELLVAEGFEVNVAVLPQGADPDGFIRKYGKEAYAEQLRTSRRYLEYLLDRAAEGQNFEIDENRRDFLVRMLSVAARIPDPAARDQFADRLAHKARIAEEVVRTEIRKAAVARRTDLTSRELPGFGQLKQAEKGLIWALFHATDDAARALAELDEGDLDGLMARSVFELARTLQPGSAGIAGASLPSGLLRRLSTIDTQLVTSIAASPIAPAPAADCVRTLKRLRYERERATVQREIDRLQKLGARQHDREIIALWERKVSLSQRIEALT